MAAPVASYLRIADDTTYTGKVRKVREQSRTVGSDTVSEQFWQQNRQANVVGVYELALAQATVAASAQDGTSTALIWAHMPSGVPSGRKARIRRIVATSHHSSALITATAPRLIAARFTFTGAATGAGVRPDDDTKKQHAMLDLRTAVTGLTVSLAGNLLTAGICGAMTAVSAEAPAAHACDLVAPDSNEDEWIVLATGEGLAIYQDVAGTASDTRKLNVSIVWDEVDTA